MPDSYPVSYPISYPVSYPTPDVPVVRSLIFTEVYPSPDTSSGEREWLEIYNYGDNNANLTGWYLRDASNKVMLLPEWEIQPGQYLVIVVDTVSLNNSGDTIELIDTNDQVIDRVEYPSLKKQQDWSRTSVDPAINSWQLGLSASPGLPNAFPIEPNSSESSASSPSSSKSSSKKSTSSSKVIQLNQSSLLSMASSPEYQLPVSYPIEVLGLESRNHQSLEYYTLPIWPVILAISMIMLVLVMLINRQIILRLITRVAKRLRVLWLWWWSN